MDYFIIILIVYMASFILARKIQEDAMAKLDLEQKGKLVDISSNKNYLKMIFPMLFLLLYFWSSKSTSVNHDYLFSIFFGVILIYMIYNFLELKKKYIAENLPDTYVQSMKKVFFVRFLGLVFIWLGFLLSNHIVF